MILNIVMFFIGAWTGAIAGVLTLVLVIGGTKGDKDE